MKYIKLACIQAIKESKKIRTASAYQVRKELNATTLIPFANQIVKHGSLFGLTSKLKDIYEKYQEQPQMWNLFKKTLGINAIDNVSLYHQLNDKLAGYLEQGKEWVNKHKQQLSEKNKYLYFMFLYADKAPTVTSSINYLLERVDSEEKQIIMQAFKKYNGGFNTFAEIIEDFFDHHPVFDVMSMPAKAYVFWLVWTNVTEISWKVTDITKGFLGLMSWGDLIRTLPETGLGLLIQVFCPFIPSGMIASSLKIGWNALIIPAMGAQFYYLYRRHLIDEKGNLIESEVLKLE